MEIMVASSSYNESKEDTMIKGNMDTKESIQEENKDIEKNNEIKNDNQNNAEFKEEHSKNTEVKNKTDDYDNKNNEKDKNDICVPWHRSVLKDYVAFKHLEKHWFL